MIKVVINREYGGFGLSEKALRRYAELKGITLIEQENEHGWTDFYLNEVNEDNLFNDREIDRADPALIQVVEEMGSIASGNFSALKIVELPEDVEWNVHEYDGLEWIAEKHRIWT